MTSISYPRAIASCLPMVGPFVAAYNVWEVRRETPSGLSQVELRLGILSTQARIAEIRGDREALSEVSNNLGIARDAFINSNLAPYEKKRLYSICGLVGSVLSVACIVGLVALGVLKTYLGFLGAGAFLIHAGLHAWNWYLVSDTINELKGLTALRA